MTHCMRSQYCSWDHPLSMVRSSQVGTERVAQKKSATASIVQAGSSLPWLASIVGARIAGTSTALLLARKGYRLLLVDRAIFPSDILSTHQIQLPGSAALKRWGLLDQVIATDP